MTKLPPVPDRTSRLLAQRVREIFRHLPKGLAGVEESIHQMRVAGRRLRVALPLLARKPQGRRVRRALTALRQLTRAAGSSRDLDVSLALLEERLSKTGPLTPERTLLRRRLRTTRGRSRARMAEALMDLEIARLRRDLRRVLGRGAEDAFTARLRLRQIRDEGGAELVESFTALGTRFDPDALHRLRIRARRLRYAAELSDTLRGRPSEAPELFKRLQEVLGGIHDDHVLATWLAGQASAAEARGTTVLAEEARALETHFRAAAQRGHAELLELAPVALVSRALEAMGQARPAA